MSLPRSVADILREHVTLSMDALREHIGEDRRTHDPPAPDVVAAAVSDGFAESVRDVLIYSPDEVGTVASLPHTQAREALAALSCPLGCQPDFRRPIDENRLRRFPFFELQGGRYFLRNRSGPRTICRGIRQVMG